jgi:hypothetical protein
MHYLMMNGAYADTRELHIRPTASHIERAAARAYLMSLPGHEALVAAERPRRAGEPEEPERQP